MNYSLKDLIAHIKSKYPGTQTADLQSKVWDFCIKKRRKDEEVTTPDIYENERFSDYSRNQIYTAVNNLAEKVEALEKNQPSGNDQVFIHDRLDTLHFTFGETTQDELEKDFKLLIAHCRENSKVLEIVAESLSVDQDLSQIKKELLWRQEDLEIFTAVNRYDKAVMYLERSEAINIQNQEYGRMGWRGVANRIDIIESSLKEALS